MTLPTQKSKRKTRLEDYLILIHGRPKIGKSTFCSHFPNTLFLAFEQGLNFLEVYQQPVTSWNHLLDEVLPALAKKDHEYKTIVWDTVEIAWDLCARYIVGQHSKKEGSAYINDPPLGYGKGINFVNTEIERVLTKLAACGFGIVLIAHTRSDPDIIRGIEYQRNVPDLGRASRKAIVDFSDMILYFDMEETTDEKGDVVENRVIRTRPSVHYEAGGRISNLPETIPLDYEKFKGEFEKAVGKENEV